MSDIGRYADNAVDLSALSSYAAILGSNPSRGARSPVLWNAAFEVLGLPTRMIALDISQDNLPALLSILENDDRFVGGAVAVPYKEQIADWLKSRGEERLTQEARAIGAVNCLYRNSYGELCATNTDGEGAIRCLEQVYSLEGARVLLLGPGGAGKAVAAYLSKAIGPDGRLVISARNMPLTDGFAMQLGGQTTVWPPPTGSLRDVDVLVNCTSVGSSKVLELNGKQINLEGYTPLARLDASNENTTARLLGEPEGDLLVFDIIYDPSPTRLLALAQSAGHRVVDGGEMNLQQALLAFSYASGASNAEMTAVRSSMLAARSRF